MRIPRTRGAICGVLLVLLGLWGALVPYIGAYFDFSVGNDRTWDFTPGRFWLSLLPGCVAMIAGVGLVSSVRRATAALSACLGIVAGTWFAIGPDVSTLWNGGAPQTGLFLGGTVRRAFEMLAYFHGLGAVIVAVAAFALGRVIVRSARDVEDDRQPTVPVAPEYPPTEQFVGEPPARRREREPITL